MKVKRTELTWWERLYLPTLLNGFKVTLRHFFSWKRSGVYGDKQKEFTAKTTMQYPEEKWDVPTGYRGAPYLVKDEDEKTKCVSCQLCEFVCPSKAIRITPPGDNGMVDREGAEKMPKEFEINMLRCIYCGFCQEACPEEAIFLLEDYAINGESREELVYNKEKLLELGGADKRAYNHHVQCGVDEGIKKWETKTREADEQPAFH
ncbi:MAG TPA: NADH-quinone oxidoreductase subunit I [Verrucomicrobiota bacterium]|nr:NADH-quinone oxidoreductase subunit I [Verrucomicrobiota bacterium]